MRDYDAEAADYDRARGGDNRAIAAAFAVAQLFPPDTRHVLDLAGGTGVVSRFLSDEHDVVLADRSVGMLRIAAGRLPGRVLRGDATGLPLRTGSLDAVYCVWLLHLLPADAVRTVIGEAARVLRPGGRFITTVDKSARQYQPDTDTGALLHRLAPPGTASDDRHRIAALTAAHGLRHCGEAGFTGVGQGRSPAELRERTDLLPQRYRGAPDVLIARVRRQLGTLPDQDAPRPDPVYRVHAYENAAPLGC